MVAPYTANRETLVADKPRPWSTGQLPVVTWRSIRSFALHPDGARIALPAPRDASASRQDKVVFVLNFFDEIRRLAPTSR
jgi:hypothetical protein